MQTVRHRAVPVVLVHAPVPEHLDNGATLRALAWAESAFAVFREDSRFRVIPLFGELAKRTTIEDTLRGIAGEKGLVVFYGHGSNCGHSLIESQDGPGPALMAALCTCNADLLANKIVYAVACHSAKTLGSTAVGSGTISYIGYWSYVWTAPGDSAEGFMESANAGLRVLARDGGTTGEAYRAIRDEYLLWIRFWRASGNHERKLALMQALGGLREPLGDLGACLVP
jgi:hypothetical protein